MMAQVLFSQKDPHLNAVEIADITATCELSMTGFFGPRTAIIVRLTGGFRLI